MNFFSDYLILVMSTFSRQKFGVFFVLIFKIKIKLFTSNHCTMDSDSSPKVLKSCLYIKKCYQFVHKKEFSSLLILIFLHGKMLKNGQTYFNNLAVLTLKDFQGIFDHFLTLCIKWLNFLRVVQFPSGRWAIPDEEMIARKLKSML